MKTGTRREIGCIEFDESQDFEGSVDHDINVVIKIGHKIDT